MSNIAYQLINDEVNNAITEDILVALNFEINRNFNDGVLFSNNWHFKIYKVYYKPLEVEFYQVPILEEAEPVIYSIVENEPDDDIIEEGYRPYVLGDTPEEPNPNQLDFYDLSSTEFVFFSIDQLTPIVKNFESLVISGCSLDLGKIIYPTELTEGIPEGLFFSLKIEAQLEDIGADSPQGTIHAPTFAIGLPCPPSWYPYQAINSLRLGSNTDPGVAQKRFQAWLDFINSISAPAPIPDPNDPRRNEKPKKKDHEER